MQATRTTADRIPANGGRPVGGANIRRHLSRSSGYTVNVNPWSGATTLAAASAREPFAKRGEDCGKFRFF